MFDKYSYKTKLRFLLLFTVVLCIAAYRRSFSNFIALYSENKALLDRNAAINSQQPNLRQLTNQIANLNQLIGKDGIQKDKIQQGIVDFLVEKKSKAVIGDLQPVHEFFMEDYLIYTFQLDLVGDYRDLQHIAYLFEKDFNLSKVVSLNFYKEKRSNKNEILHLKLIFQNYENKK